MGFTHIEFLPVSEHPFDGSWGYQPTGLYAPTSRFGTPEDFSALVDACHREGIGVWLDWVPGHFPDDPHGLGYFDGTALYEHANPLQGRHLDWGTLIYNYGRTEVVNSWFPTRCSGLIATASTPARRRRRLDAYLATAGRRRVDSEPAWCRENLEAIEFLPASTSTVRAFSGATTAAEESTHGAGLAAGRIWRARLRFNGTWAGCTTR